MNQKTQTFNFHSAAFNLRKILGAHPPLITIYTYCTHVSKSGMSRDIKAVVIDENLIYTIGFGRVKGCGMDMGFHVAETIFCLAYPNLRYQDYLTHKWI